MSDDWETGDFEIKKEDDSIFENEQLKLKEKPVPVAPVQPSGSEAKPVKKETKPVKKPEAALEDPIAEKERIAKLTNQRRKTATGKTGWGFVWCRKCRQLRRHLFEHRKGFRQLCQNCLC